MKDRFRRRQYFYDKPREAGMSLMDYYGNLLQANKNHSSEASIASLIKRAQGSLAESNSSDVVLDLGSARQFFERAYMLRHGKLPFQVVSLDFADLKPHQLLARKSSKVDHVRGDGNRLPIRDATITAVVSNMALDFMQEDAIKEMRRVLKPGGQAHINLSYPALDLNNVPDLERIIRDPSTSPSKRKELLFWREYLREHPPLISNPDQAREVFEKNGFIVRRVEEVEDPRKIYDWCEIDVINPVISSALPAGSEKISNSTAQPVELKNETKTVILKENVEYSFA